MNDKDKDVIPPEVETEKKIIDNKPSDKKASMVEELTEKVSTAIHHLKEAVSHNERAIEAFESIKKNLNLAVDYVVKTTGINKSGKDVITTETETEEKKEDISKK